MVEQGTHKPLVGSSTLPPGIGNVSAKRWSGVSAELLALILENFLRGRGARLALIQSWEGLLCSTGE